MHSRCRVAGLWLGGDGADFHVPEAQVHQRGSTPACFIESGGQPEGRGKLQAHHPRPQGRVSSSELSVR